MKVMNIFQNETGNRISLLVDAEPTNVHIEIEGPSSTSTNLLTRMEAEKLHAALGKALRKSAKSGLTETPGATS